MSQEILKILEIIFQFSNFDKLKRQNSKNTEMDQSLAEKIAEVIKIFDLEIDDNLKPCGINKQRFPNAVDKLGR